MILCWVSVWPCAGGSGVLHSNTQGHTAGCQAGCLQRAVLRLRVASVHTTWCVLNCSTYMHLQCAAHYTAAPDDKPRQLLAHLLALLLVSFPALATAELLQALQDLCVLAQQRMDGLHLQQLQAALVAAYSSVSQAATLSGSQQRSPPAGEALTPTSSSSSNNSNANGRVGTSHDTNAVGPLHLVKVGGHTTVA